MKETDVKQRSSGSKKGDRRHHQWETARRYLENDGKVERVLVKMDDDGTKKKQAVTCLRLLSPPSSGRRLAPQAAEIGEQGRGAAGG
eukprot:CAMPEP_0180330488 /NCGR_PEP_ID=MMETSP0988-20121125/41363_1 /TAXON_ID=697907 /ORGANISM="non described non described, Strain CCMP2293" /LENGTH=86 /DNA_ID=CAMNT_0022317745 /DNA_START=9 /DNA_END=265 /DNA_ORIENTATION=-